MATIFFPFCWIPSLLFYKGRGREDGVGRWGLTGTLIDMSLFYLLNEFFLSLELKRHAETILYFDHLHDNKYKQIIRPDLLGWEVGVNGHAYRYVLILPVKRVFPFFGVKASRGDDSLFRPSA